MIKLDLNPPRPQLLQFGWIATAGFPAAGAALTWIWDWSWQPPSPFWVLLAVGALMGLLAAAGATAAIRPVYVVMMLIGWPIGMVLSTVLLALIYYGMFTPVGLAFRLVGRDLLHCRPDPSAESYWRIRDRERTPASYLRLY